MVKVKGSVEERGFGKDYFSKFSKLFFHPKTFSNSIEKDKDYRQVMFFYVKSYFIVAVLSLIIGAIIIGSSGGLTGALIAKLIVSLVVGTGFAFLTPFIFGGIVHLGVLILGGKEGYFNTYNPSTYGATLSLPYTIITSVISYVLTYSLELTTPAEIIGSKLYIFSMLVIVAQLIHTTYFEVLAISKTQKMSKWKAFFSIILVPLALLILAVIVFFSLASMSFPIN